MAMSKRIGCLLILAMVLTAGASWAAEPQEVLKAYTDRFVGILRDPAYAQGAKKAEQSERLWKVIQEGFDFQGIAIVAVGTNWRRFSQTEKDEFTTLFSQLLRNNYLKKIQEGYQNEAVRVLSQEINGEKALVKSSIHRERGDTPVDYRLWLRDGNWKIYDVLVEGVSLVQNYRTQFNEFLLKGTPAGLIQRVKDMLAQGKT
jgi:phospholipid transport system substrate-binding protein